MTLGDVRQFLTSIEGIPDEATIKARVSWGKHLRSLTVEEEDVGFRDYLRAVKPDDNEAKGRVDARDRDARDRDPKDRDPKGREGAR